MLPRGRHRPKKDPTSAGDAKSDSTQDPGNRQALPKNFVDRTIPILRRQPQVAMKKISEVVEILFQQRPVQLVFDQKLFLNVCRQFSLPIKRAPRHQMDQKKSERDDTKEDDYQGDPSFGDEAEHSSKPYQRLYWNARREFLPPIEKRQFDDKERGSDNPTYLLNQINRRTGRSSGCQKIVNQHNMFAWVDCVHMHFHFRISVLQLVRGSDRLIWKLAFFANRNTADTQLVCYCGSEQEAPRINSNYLRGMHFFRHSRQVIYHAAKQFSIPQNGGNIFENDPRFRKIRDISDSGVKLFKFGYCTVSHIVVPQAVVILRFRR